MTEITKIFAQRIRELRKARNLSQEGYAEFLNINTRTLSNIENAKGSTQFEIIEKIANAENLPPSSLFMSDEEILEKQKEQLNTNNNINMKKLSFEDLNTIQNVINMALRTYT